MKLYICNMDLIYTLDQTNEIAGAHATVLAHIALKGGAFGLWHIGHGSHVQTKARIAVEVDKCKIVGVNIVTRFNVACGHTNHGVVFAHGLALGDWTGSDFVSGGNLCARTCRQTW